MAWRRSREAATVILTGGARTLSKLVCIAGKSDGKRHLDLTKSCKNPSPEGCRMEIKWICGLLAVQRQDDTPHHYWEKSAERIELCV